MKKRQEQYALAYFIALLTVAVVSAVIAMGSVDNLVLGTEMNTNGMVEYLCLGKGCEVLP